MSLRTTLLTTANGVGASCTQVHSLEKKNTSSRAERSIADNVFATNDSFNEIPALNNR